MVPPVGIEPTHPCGYKILSLARLPIPPQGHNKIYINIDIAGAQYKHPGLMVKLEFLYATAKMCP